MHRLNRATLPITTRLWGRGRVDCITFVAVISCAVLLQPLFAIGLPAMAVMWRRPTVKSQRRSATVLHLPTEKPAVDHYTRKAA